MFSLILLSIGLAMDAVAVALVRGAAAGAAGAADGSNGRRTFFLALETAAIFGAAQAIMPIIGWSVGAIFSGSIAAFGHWIAFGLLGFLGLRMVVSAGEHAAGSADDRPDQRRSHYAGLTIAAIATSIDAAAAGVTLPIVYQPVLTACVIIGAVTAGLCLPAYWMGGRVSRMAGAASAGKAAEIIGGAVLIGLGVKILLQHLLT